jgi:hypothetical protein
VRPDARAGGERKYLHVVVPTGQMQQTESAEQPESPAGNQSARQEPVTAPLDLRDQLEQVVLEGFTAVDHGRAVDSLSQLTADFAITSAGQRVGCCFACAR